MNGKSSLLQGGLRQIVKSGEVFKIGDVFQWLLPSDDDFIQGYAYKITGFSAMEDVAFFGPLRAQPWDHSKWKRMVEFSVEFVPGRFYQSIRFGHIVRCDFGTPKSDDHFCAFPINMALSHVMVRDSWRKADFLPVRLEITTFPEYA